MGSRFTRSLRSLNREDSDKYTLTITYTHFKFRNMLKGWFIYSHKKVSSVSGDRIVRPFHF